MKLFGGMKKNNRNQSIVIVLWIGLVVLVINMVIYMIHFFDVQHRFRAVKVNEVYQDLVDACFIFEAGYTDVQGNLTQIAKALANDPDELKEENICASLENCNASGMYLDLYYISDEGVSYSDKGEITGIDKRELKDHYQAVKPTIEMEEDEFSSDGNGILKLMQPVSVEGKKVGQLYARVAMTGMFDGDVFAGLTKMGDVFLINGDGDIYLRNTTMFADEGQRHTNVFELLGEQAVDGVSKKNVADMKRRLAIKDTQGVYKNSYLKYQIVDKYGVTDYAEAMAVSGIRGSFLIIVYPETIYTEVTRPLLFRTLITSMLLFLITIIMVIYMWWTSKTSSDLVEKLAYDDPVTGGKNDNYFREVASRAIWENASIPFVVTRFDIANFRYINEAYGHTRADELLRIIDRESNKIFTGREICARMTADQFLLLARNDQHFDAKFEELLGIINDQAREIGIMFPIRLKRGVYPIRRDDTDIGIIIDHANAARKSLTGDEKLLVATYSEQIISQMFLNDKIESEMENAMKTEEFKVFIQAKWDIKNDRVHGGEALVRWIKPDGTRIFPDQFIPVFEKNGFVEKLDMYMLEQVCKHQRQLIDEGKRIYPISVNQSRLLMHNPDYLPQVERLMKRYRIPNGFVELEITETVFQDERELMISTANELKKMDIMLSMDDFGSGYSSLNMLKDVPFDLIKIDREFFSESITSKASVWILRKIIEMAEGLGIRTLCEGVENQEQVNLLRDLGCYYVQGYFYSKPMPFHEYIGKYCEDFEGGKEYYDKLYEEQAQAREKRRREEEEEKAVSASSAVEEFKKTYTASAKEEKRETEKVDQNGKKLSSEEIKLAYLAGTGSKQRDAEKDGDGGNDQSESGTAGAEEKTKMEGTDQQDKPAKPVSDAAEAVRQAKLAKEEAERKARERQAAKETEKGRPVMSAAEAVMMAKQAKEELEKQHVKGNNSDNKIEDKTEEKKDQDA
ncbi:MAG: EAL domain-containing protein [Lachnospiraceae bacterium]|nr:EAL domain-containing protein [Lachnospiraceae bacterium]